MSSKDNNEECAIHLTSDKIELMNNNNKWSYRRALSITSF